MRFLVGNLVTPHKPTTFANIETAVPDIYKNTDRTLSRLPAPRYLKSHEPFDRRYNKVIYLVRDPRDVAVSYYHYLIKARQLEEAIPIEEYVKSFVAGKLGGFGTWRENVGSWLGARKGSEGFLFIRYEDLLKHPVEELHKVASLLSVEVQEDQFHRATELSAADHMRELEKSQGWKPEKRNREDKPFVRYAEAGNWKTSLPGTSVSLIEERWGGLMQELGYLP